MDLEIYADLVCPWCYIGKRRLERALDSVDQDVTVHFRPFQLDPSPVSEPRPLIGALAEKFGGVDRARQMLDHTTTVAAADGLELRFDRAVTANTFDGHRLVWFADARGLGSETVDALYRAYFTDGVDIGSRAALATVAAGVGLPEPEVRRFLDSTDGETEGRAAPATARELGVTSVPTFVLAGKYAVTGAQEPDVLRAALAEVAQREADSGA